MVWCSIKKKALGQLLPFYLHNAKHSAGNCKEKNLHQ